MFALLLRHVITRDTPSPLESPSSKDWTKEIAAGGLQDFSRWHSKGRGGSI